MKRKSQQFSREKSRRVVDWIMAAADRSAQRRALAEKWLEESPYTNYRYCVETCDDGSRVYLLRPTWLNKGFDFQVNVEGFKSKTRKSKGQTAEMPSHKDVKHDLATKVKAAPKLKEELFRAISEVYDCREPSDVLEGHPLLRKLDAGLPVDKTLRIIKWLFVEQDLTYWLQTGRNMLMSAIEKDVFDLDAELKG